MDMLQELVLHEFRNYPILHHYFQPGFNIFIGRNGSGKTNLLEAIHFILNGQSFRNVKQNDLSRNRQGELGIRLKWQDGGTQTLSLTLEGRKKKTLLNNKVCDINQVRQMFKVIFFSSQDIDLILLSPSKRREFFDGMMTSLKDDYRITLREYQRLLQYRNHELAKEKKSTHWDKKLIALGQRLITMRVSFLMAISSPLKKIFFLLSRNQEFDPQITYCCNGEILRNSLTLESYHEIFSKYRERDQYRGFTHFGPHSDDYFFYLQNNLSKVYSSQGENRLFVFALKFALHEYFKKVVHKKPLLILDDVFNDFDPERLTLFFRYLEKQDQVLLACANESLFKPYLNKKAVIYEINKGIITPWNSKI